MSAVLLNGQLNKDILGQAKKEVSGYFRKNEPFTLVVNSQGGDIDPTFDFVDFLNESPKSGLLEGIKIYNSGSAATFLTLSLKAKRSMYWKSKLGLHLGCIVRIEFVELDSEGRVPSAHFDRLNKYYDKLILELVNHKLLSGLELQEKLIPKGSMELTARECLQRGFVQSLF